MCYDAPDPPDYGAAATAQGAANVESAVAGSRLNNPNVINPYGSQTWVEGATDTSRPTMVQELSPEQQALYDKSVQTKSILGDLGIQGSQALGDVIGQNLDLSRLPAAPGDAAATRDQVINAMMSRVNEDVDRSIDQRNSDLIAAGIRPGTEAYDNAMAQIERGRTDARQQAIIASGSEAQRDYQMDADRRRTALSELLAGRQTPLNEINALMSGSQVSNPFAVPNAAQNTQVAPAPIFGAAQAQYGADLGAYNAQQAGMGNIMSGLFGLGSAAIKAPTGTFSDRRLKRNIRRIGTHILGIGLYAWDYIWGEHADGVMADEVLTVMPDAVLQHPSGYMMVDYERLNNG